MQINQNDMVLQPLSVKARVYSYLASRPNYMSTTDEIAGIIDGLISTTWTQLEALMRENLLMQTGTATNPVWQIPPAYHSLAQAVRASCIQAEQDRLDRFPEYHSTRFMKRFNTFCTTRFFSLHNSLMEINLALLNLKEFLALDQSQLSDVGKQHYQTALKQIEQHVEVLNNCFLFKPNDWRENWSETEESEITQSFLEVVKLITDQGWLHRISKGNRARLLMMKLQFQKTG